MNLIDVFPSFYQNKRLNLEKLYCDNQIRLIDMMCLPEFIPPEINSIFKVGISYERSNSIFYPSFK